MHQIENDEDGIFNFDIKLENFLVKEDRIYLSDIDGFIPGKVPFELNRHMVYKLVWPRYDRTSACKRLGCLNDIFAVIVSLILKIDGI